MNSQPSDAASVGEVGSTPDETFRASLHAGTPEDGPATLVVTRQGLGRAGRVWLMLGGATVATTLVLTDDQADELAALITAARGARSADPAR